MKENTRDAMRRVMRQAMAAGVAKLAATDLLLGMGRRDSDARTYSGFDIERIMEYEPEMDASHINWGLSATTGFDPLLVVQYRNELHIEWKLITDASLTMDFGSEELKRITGAVLAAIFALTAQENRDPIAQIIHDEYDRLRLTEQMSGNELLGVGLPFYLEAVSQGLNSPRRRNGSGMAEALRHLPVEVSIVPVISDFHHFPEDARQRLAQAARFHRVMCCVVVDDRELGFKKSTGQITVVDMNSRRRFSMAAAEADRTVAEDHAAHMADLTAFFEAARIPYAVFSTSDSPSELGRKLVRLINRRGA